MANITSKHDAPLPFPGGVTLQPGATIKVDRWNVVKNMDIVKAWLGAGAIVAEETADDAVSLEPVAANHDVDIPENWGNLTWQDRRSLAATLSVGPIRTSDEADAVIDAEVKRRKA